MTWLYVPGDRPAVVAKALTSGADVVLIDLEDGVAPDRKDYALDATAELLSTSDATAPAGPPHVRLSASGGPRAEREVDVLAALPGLGGLRLPKVGGPADVRWVAERARGARSSVVPPLYPLLESARGIEAAFAIATAHPAVCGIALGEADLRADIGVTDDAGLDWPRSRAVVAARAAELAPPPQSVFTDVRDLTGLAASCAAGRALGFLGRTAIHPRQLPVIERAFLPSPEEVGRAEEIVTAALTEAGALALPDGRFVDPAVVAGAQRTLALARRGRRTG
ncbi:CoA ester lyase [Streptomyces sp. AJS327]|nr:CoA ester lyase [Streptomyces sp. AJS327]MBA0051017.1 CoA ester lyase [Streptomyces sp. AJS327]